MTATINPQQPSKKPVIIAGAGPAGLCVALVLQRYNESVKEQDIIPFIIIERADYTKLVSDVGSGYDLSSTTLRILRHLGLKLDDDFSPSYEAVFQYQLDDRSVIRKLSISNGDFPKDMEFRSSPRSDLQRLFIDALDLSQDDNNDASSSSNSAVGKIKCGTSVIDHEETDDGTVLVKLSDGTTIEGRALLAADGIKSSVRTQMKVASEFQEIANSDRLEYSGVDVWWGKTPLSKGSRLDEIVKDAHEGVDGERCLMQYLGTRKAPGSLLVILHGEYLMWALGMNEATAPSSDSHEREEYISTTHDSKENLVVRGGKSGPSVKNEMMQLLSQSGNYDELLTELIAATPDHLLTRVGIYDRGLNDGMPFISEKSLVALLGDAAHPQTPYLSQGCNMALADAFVAATLLTKESSVQEALTTYASEGRREDSRMIIRQARSFAKMFTSSNPFICPLLNLASRWTPASWIIGDISVKDKVNVDFVEMVTNKYNIDL